MLKVNEVKQLQLGMIGENLFRVIKIDMTPWMEVLPDGVPSIIHIRPGETEADAYIANTTFEDNILSWEITAGDLGETPGNGRAQIWLEEDAGNSVTKRGKSLMVYTKVEKAINDASETVPDPQEAWMEAMTALKVATVNAAGDAEDSAEDSEAWATGKRGGVDVESTDPTYHNNSEYYAGQAAGYSSTASGYATNAGNSAGNAAASATAAGNAKTAAETAQGKAEEAQGKAENAQEAAEAALGYTPYIDSTTGNWMRWDSTTSQWVNTGVYARGDTGAVPNIQVGTVTTLLPGESATVTRRSGSPDTAPIFDFGIPKGDTGQAENIYGNTIDMSEIDSTKVSDAIGAKIPKVSSAGYGNVPTLDFSGSLSDSGKYIEDFQMKITTSYDSVNKNVSVNIPASRGGN